jgi:hypothetical protein
MLPNSFVIGAAKAATTSHHAILAGRANTDDGMPEDHRRCERVRAPTRKRFPAWT